MKRSVPICEVHDPNCRRVGEVRFAFGLVRIATPFNARASRLRTSYMSPSEHGPMSNDQCVHQPLTSLVTRRESHLLDDYRYRT